MLRSLQMKQMESQPHCLLPTLENSLCLVAEGKMAFDF